MKKKLSLSLAFIVMLSAIFSISSFAASDVSVYVDNEYTYLTDADGNTVYPFIQNGTTYIPVRGISQALDCIVEWDGNNRNVMIYKDVSPDGKVFRNNSNDVKLYVDNEEQKLYDANGTEVKPFIKDGTTYVPLRGVSKVLGYPVEWEGYSKSVYVWKDKVSPNGVTIDFLRPIENRVIDRYYESDGSTVKIDDISYTNAIGYGSWSGDCSRSAIFNLNGKYDKITFIAGSTDWKHVEKTIQFVLDGKLIHTITLAEQDFAIEEELELNNGLQLKVVFDKAPCTALADITFYGE